MDKCIHHWKQEGDLRSPFVCKHCGEVKQMETDFYALYETHYGRPFERTEQTGTAKPGFIAA